MYFILLPSRDYLLQLRGQYSGDPVTLVGKGVMPWQLRALSADPLQISDTRSAVAHDLKRGVLPMGEWWRSRGAPTDDRQIGRVPSSVDNWGPEAIGQR